jgi:hypothetical protein
MGSCFLHAKDDRGNYFTLPVSRETLLKITDLDPDAVEDQHGIFAEQDAEYTFGERLTVVRETAIRLHLPKEANAEAKDLGVQLGWIRAIQPLIKAYLEIDLSSTPENYVHVSRYGNGPPAFIYNDKDAN